MTDENERVDSLLASAPTRRERVIAPEAPTADPRLSPRGGGSSKFALIAIAVFIVAALAGAGWWKFGGSSGDESVMKVNGKPIVNAQQMVNDLVPSLRSIAATDGAPLLSGAGCWFAPAAKTQQKSVAQSRIACGPVRLGVAGDNELWLVDTPTYSGTNELRGRVSEFDSVEQLDASSLRRPDGKRPPKEDPQVGTEGVRNEDGRIITNAAAYISRADAAFAASKLDAGTQVTPETRCYLAVQQVARGNSTIRKSAGGTWCGPVRTKNSAPGTGWAVYSSYASNNGLVAAELNAPSITLVNQTKSVPPEVQLWRPDGKVPTVFEVPAA